MAFRRRICVAIALIPFVQGCFNSSPTGYQGYAEGEFVYLASSQAGHLQHLSVTRGQKIEQGELAFTLDATVETAEQQQAQQQLAAAEAQLADIRTGKRPPEIAVHPRQLIQAHRPPESLRSSASGIRLSTAPAVYHGSNLKQRSHRPRATRHA